MTMTVTGATGRLARIPILAALALVLIGAGPSAGERSAATPGPSAEPPVTVGPCQDDRATLVSTGGGADGVVFRCVGGIPVPRQGPWSTDGCVDAEYHDEATLAVVPADPWQPADACLLAAPSWVGILGEASDAIPRGR